MDLQSLKSQYGAKWARTGALILFVVTGLLLVASLTTARSQGSLLQAGTVFTALYTSVTTS
jgi:hypothetical protein